MAMSNAERQKRWRDRQRAKRIAAEGEAAVRNPSPGSREAPPLQEARIRNYNAQTAKIELETKVKNGELVSKSEVKRWMEARNLPVRTAIEALPARLKMLRPNLDADDMAAVRRLVYEITAEITA